MLTAGVLSLGITIVAAQGPLRTAVIVVGDELAAGALQKDLDEALGKVPGIERVPAGASAAALAGGAGEVPPPAVDATTRKAWEDLFVRVQRAYLDDRLQEALVLLNEIRGLHEKAAFVPAAERQRQLLLHAMLLLAQGDEDNAAARVRAALALAPATALDPGLYPPSVRSLAERVRREGFREVRLVVRGVPDGAKVLVDGRPMPAGGKVPAGHHRVAAWAPGFRWTETRVEADQDAEVVFSLPLSPPADAEQALRRTALLGADTLPDVAVLEALAKSVEARALVIATRTGFSSASAPSPCEGDADQTGRIAAVLWRANRPRTVLPAPRYPDDAEGTRRLSAWLSDALQQQSRGFFAALGTSVRAGVGPGFRDSRVIDEDAGYETANVGTQLAAGVSVAPGFWSASLDGELVLYGGGVVVQGEGIDRPGSPREKVGAGGALAVRVAAGRRFLLLGNTFERGTWVAARAYGAAEHFKADDLKDENGQRLGFFPSRRNLAAGPEARGGIFLPWGGANLELAVVGLWRRWDQFPAGTLGTRPVVTPTGLVEGSVSVRPFSKVQRLQAARLNLTYRGEYRSVRFSGLARAPVEPRIHGARLDEHVHSLALTAEWRP